jgi:hypothetical protein
MRRRVGLVLALLLGLLLPASAQIRFQGPSGASGALTELPLTGCTNEFMRGLSTAGVGNCDPIATADLPASVLLSSGSYADPTWLTSLAYSKLTGAPSAVLTTGSYADPAWLTSLAYSKLTGLPTLVNSLTGTTNQVSVSGSTGDVTLSLPQAIHSGASPTFAGLTLTGGTPGVGKLLTSDGSGVASWQDAPAGGGPGTGSLNTLAFWATTSTLGSSLLTTDGTNITLSSGTLISPALRVTGGSLAANKVLTSDASGNATWQNVTIPASQPIAPETTNTSDIGTTSARFKKGYLTAGFDVAQGTLTANDPAWSSTATWNSSGVTFTHLKADITSTASAAASLLLDLQVGASSKFSVRKDGLGTFAGGLTLSGGVFTLPNGTDSTPTLKFATSSAAFYGTSTGIALTENSTARFAFSPQGSPSGFVLANDMTLGWSSTTSAAASADTVLRREAAHTLAQRFTTNAQTFRTYGTYTDASNYVRASLGASSTLVTLAAETAGTGADDVSIHLAPAGTGTVNLASGALTATGELVLGQAGQNTRLRTALTTPSSPALANGDWWVTCTGTTPTRHCQIAVQDTGSVREIARSADF